MDHSQTFSTLIGSVILRTALGCYVIYSSRWFYANPMGYFRRKNLDLPDTPWFRQIVRGLACFCLWGGCFIIATALISVAALATWLLLPKTHSDAER